MNSHETSSAPTTRAVAPSATPPDQVATPPNSAILRIGGVVAQHRARLGQVQKQLAESVLNSNRTEIAELEEGRRLPPGDRLEAICEALDIPEQLWRAATHPEFLQAMEFQAALSNLLGKPLTISQLGPNASLLAVDRIARLLKGRHTEAQAFDSFRSVLTFYGERAPTQAFFHRFLGDAAFKSLNAFQAKVTAFMAIALRLYGNFRRAWKTLSVATDLTPHLRVLDPINPDLYTNRRPFSAITSIPLNRLDDLGYISVERAKKEHRDRQSLSDGLRELANGVEKSGSQHFESVPLPKRRRLEALLRHFDSPIDISATLFTETTPATLRAEADRVAPQSSDLAQIEATQQIGIRNHCAYLSEPFIDVYVATSMRDHADFVAVHSFVHTLFDHTKIAPLHLRYFDPTQSWIPDRVAKGLVEALMLRRAKLTIYMAQQSDTFGKNSEASVALGQGKAVIVYVPRLHSKSAGIDSQRVARLTLNELRDRARDLGLPDDETLESNDLIVEILKAQLSGLSPEQLSRVVLDHWADFDLPGEAKRLPPVLQKPWLDYLGGVTNSAAATSLPTPDATLSQLLAERLSSIALAFEKRAKLFREQHPLALQVIVRTGVVNGIMVARSIDESAEIMYRLLTNTIDTDIKEDEHNILLCERISGSTLRVVSKYPLLTNAFWTQYFDDRDDDLDCLE